MFVIQASSLLSLANSRCRQNFAGSRVPAYCVASLISTQRRASSCDCVCVCVRRRKSETANGKIYEPITVLAFKEDCFRYAAARTQWALVSVAFARLSS